MTKGATSYKETSFGIIPRKKLILLEIKGVKKGSEFLLREVRLKRKLKITPALIKKLHWHSFGWIFPKWAGKFRTIQVTYSGKEAPPYFQVPELVLNLCRDLNERLKHLPALEKDDYLYEVVQFLAWWQHQFVVIHPFNDYNGRLARMLTALILVNLGLPPTEIKAETGKDRKRYIKSMQLADNGNYKLLETLLLQALTEALKRFHEIPNY